MSPSTGLILSPASEPFPQKLVGKVKSGQFVEMRELLSDNIALIQQLEDIQGFPIATVGATRPRLREVSSLPTWCYCFLGYMAILTPDPTTRDQLAYARLIIREAPVDKGGGTTTESFANREQWTTPSHGIPSSLDCRQPLSSGTDRSTARHFVPYAEVSTIHGPNVPCSIFSHPPVGPQHLTLPLVPGATSFAYPGTRELASSPLTARTGMCAPPVSYSTRQKTAPGPQTAPFTNGSIPQANDHLQILASDWPSIEMALAQATL
jgi:hypothetical protein